MRRSRLKIFLLYFAPQFSVYTKFGIDPSDPRIKFFAPNTLYKKISQTQAAPIAPEIKAVFEVPIIKGLFCKAGIIASMAALMFSTRFPVSPSKIRAVRFARCPTNNEAMIEKKRKGLISFFIGLLSPCLHYAHVPGAFFLRFAVPPFPRLLS